MARIDVDALRWLDWWLDGSSAVAEGDRELLIELVQSIEADTWRTTRWYTLYDPSEDVYDCQPRPGLHILMYEEPNDDGDPVVGILGIHYSPDHDAEN
ncbi:hypothetical protein [Kribbella swartbergensis]